MGQAFFTRQRAWNWVLSPGLSQWSAQMVEVCETMAESSVMHSSSASTKAGTGMEDSLSVSQWETAAARRRAAGCVCGGYSADQTKSDEVIREHISK